jgi:hypothetical protein
METRLCSLIAVHTQTAFFLLYHFRDQFFSDVEMETRLCSLIAGAHTKQRLAVFIVILF